MKTYIANFIPCFAIALGLCGIVFFVPALIMAVVTGSFGESYALTLQPLGSEGAWTMVRILVFVSFLTALWVAAMEPFTHKKPNYDNLP